MSIKKHLKKVKIKRTSKKPLATVVLLFMFVGAYFLNQTQAASNIIYIAPAASSAYVGDTFSVQVRIRAINNVNAAFVDLNYNAAGLQVTSIQRGSSFPNENEPTRNTVNGNTGTIIMKSTRNSSTTGDFHFATITFRARTTGSYSLTPLTSSDVIDYGGPVPFHSYTVARGTYTFSVRPTTPPPVKPPPVVQPPPVQPQTPTVTPTPPPRVSLPATQSAPSLSNLVISNFDVSNISYRSAVLTWTTNKPATSKVNYGASVYDMPDEIFNNAKNTSHKIVLEGESIRAGNTYAIRITSDDGSGPVTLDGEFATKGVDILVVVTDTDGNPVEGAKVSSGSSEAITDVDGIARISVAEGNVSIDVAKDELYGNLSTEVFVPEAENQSPQQVEVTVDDEFAVEGTDAGSDESGGAGIWIIFVLFIVLAAVGLVIFVRRRRSRANATVYQEAPAKPPQQQNVHVVSEADASMAHHATLPELVSQGLAASHHSTPPAAPNPIPPPPPVVAPPLPAPVPPAPVKEPVKEQVQPEKKTAHKPESHSKSKPKTTQSADDGEVLQIKHDK